MEHKCMFEDRGRWSAVITAVALALAQSANAASSSDTISPPAVDFEVPRDKVHLSGQALQAIYLKGGALFMQKAAGSAKEATCLLSLWFTGDGVIQAAQLAKVSGFPLGDQACLQAALGRQFEGLPEGHLGGRTFFAIDWVFQSKTGEIPQQARITLDPSIPQLPAGGGMHPLPQYPAEALAERAHGICKMHISVSAVGVVSGIEITQSTGSEALDKACKQAVTQSSFVPAVVDGRPASGATDVAIAEGMTERQHGKPCQR